MTGVQTVLFRSLSVPGATTNVPEFHDCQRIVLEDGRRYGPLMAIFAAADLGERKFSAVNREEVRNTFAAAEVFNDSADYTYAPLGIGPLFNCLYVFRITGGPLRAKMVPVGEKEKDCATPLDPTTALGKELEVRETLAGQYSESDFPPVARWDWDRVHREQYIGIKCGHAWCEIGRPGEDAKPSFVPSPAYLTPPGSSPLPGPDRVRAIKGWYDQQHVAIEAGLTLNPGPVIATFFPDPELGTRVQNDYRNRWLPSSYVAFHGPPGIYKSKFNFDQLPGGSPLVNMSKLSLCLGTRSGCSIPDPPGSSLIESCGKKDLFLGHLMPRWWVRIESGKGVPKRVIYKCIHYREHPGVNIPATARWRWLADDETEWQYCPDGCCEVQTTSIS